MGYYIYHENFTAEGKAAAAEREAYRIAYKCNEVKPHLESSAAGVELWCIVRDGRPVYFSKSGTHTTHEECHWIGKMRSCTTKDDDIPASK